MKKLFTESGFLSEEGKKAFSQLLDPHLESLFRNLQDENEIRIVGSLVQKRVGDFIYDKILAKRNAQNKLSNMNDDEFY